MIKIITIVSLFNTFMFAQILISPIDILEQNYSKDAIFKRSNIILTKKNAKSIQDISKVKLKSKIFRYFTALIDNKIIGYAILINEKVRSKNAATMYVIDINGIIKSVEVIAFNEPIEFMASKKWMTQFDNISYETKLYIGKDIPTITGATMTARTLVNGSRIASAFYEVILKDK